MVEYKYDAWGNHRVFGLNKVDEVEVLQDIYDENAPDFDVEYLKYKQLSELNPFRYRGYFYDTETGLYFLKTRYYDPEIGRFITIDGISYLDPETINGLNLYAYCGNNPVMNVDPMGTILLSFLIGLIVGAVVGAVIGGVVASVTAYNNGARGWELFGWTMLGIVGGAVIGGAIGGAIGYVAPAISSFLGSTSFTIGSYMTAASEFASVSVTGARIIQAGILISINGLLFSKNANRFGKSKIGSNEYYNRQFDDFWNQYGNGNIDTRRSFHDYITKKSYNKWSQLKKAWEEFLRMRGIKP